MGAPVVLAYNLDGQRKLILRFVCAEMRILMRSVPASDYNQPLGALAELSARVPGAYDGPGFSDEMLVMANFTKPLFQGFLDALRRNRVQGIPLKAVLTPTNAKWDSVKLREELLREHEALHGRG